MKRQSFSAFPKEGLQFLRLLKRNNNREWFQQHKGIYESHVKAPIYNLIETLGRDFQTFAPEFVASPKVSAYRIHRDTRFAKDKSPYKTHVAAVFPHAGLGKHEGAALYLHIAPSELFVGGGLYMPLPEDLQVLRNHIAENPKGLQRIVQAPAFRRMFGSIEGDRLTRDEVEAKFRRLAEVVLPAARAGRLAAALRALPEARDVADLAALAAG